MKQLIKILARIADRCRCCGHFIEEVGAGTNCNGLCERCYENGGDDE